MSLKSATLLCVAMTCGAPFVASGAEGTTRPLEQRLDNARVFPFFAAGGGWESTITLLNVFEADISYRLTFRTNSGQPAMVTFRANDGTITTASELQARLNDDNSHRIVLMDTGALQTGWAAIDYDGESRIAGVLTFRQRVAGRPDFESSVMLTRNDQTTLYMPFDNTQQFASTVAITNPSTSDTTNLQLRFWDAAGQQILSRDIQVFPSTTVSFSLREQYPELDGRAGQMRIQGSGNRLSAIGFRFNPAGAFSTVPVVSR